MHHTKYTASQVHNLLRQLIKYLSVGGISNLFAYIIYAGLTAFGVNPISSMSIVYVAASVMAYFANRKWTFRSDVDVGKSVPRYIAIQFVGYLTNLLILSTLCYRLGISHYLAQILGMIVVAVELFFLSKYYVFRGSIS